MFKDEGIFYAVQFGDGSFYTGTTFRHGSPRRSKNIEIAMLYGFDWQIPKDLYLRQYLYGKDISYEVVEVKVKKTYEILEK